MIIDIVRGSFVAVAEVAIAVFPVLDDKDA